MKPFYPPILESNDDDDNDNTEDSIVHRELNEPSDDSSASMDDIQVPGLFDSMEASVNEPLSGFSPQLNMMSQNPSSPITFPVSNIGMPIVGSYHSNYVPSSSGSRITVLSGPGDYSKSYPVFDMRHVHRISCPTFQNIKVNPIYSTEDLKISISRQFQAQTNSIHIIDEPGKKEGTLMKTIIIIIPDQSLEICYTLLLECYGSPEQALPQIVCARLPVSLKVEQARKMIADTLKWKSLALCSYKCVLDTDCKLNECSLKDFDRIQVVNHCLQKVRFFHQPRSDVFSYFFKEVNICSSVKLIKKEIEKYFGEELTKHKHYADDDLHFCFKGRLLNDKQCIGLILSENVGGLHNEGISLYFAPKESIIITLQYKMGKQQKQQFMIVAKQTSTAELRFEASKHMNVDPLAVKLTLDKKFIDEHDNLHQFYGEKWKNGIVLVAGIKKRKTIRIKHPITGDEKAFEMYMLQPVSMLKRKVALEWNLTYLEITLYLRDLIMKNWQPLQFYPIKNNMEITLKLYPRRIMVKLVILQPKQKVKLIVNDVSEFTVDELLCYCAHKYEYPREFSRGIYKDRCLDRNLTLEQEGIQSGDTIVIAYFDQPNKLQGCLINVFMVKSDGYTVKRIGAVNSCVLLHAPKSVSCMNVEYDSEQLDNGPLPTGVYICDGPCDPVTKVCNSKAKNVPGKSRSAQLLERCKSRKPEFLRRGRSLIETRQCRPPSQLVKQSSVPVFYIPDEDETPEPKSSSSDGELSINEETGKKVPVMNQSNSDSDKTEPDFDCKHSTPDEEMSQSPTAYNNGIGTMHQTPVLLNTEQEEETDLKMDQNDIGQSTEILEEKFEVKMTELKDFYALKERYTNDSKVVNVNNEDIDPDKNLDDESRNSHVPDMSNTEPKQFINTRTLARGSCSEDSGLDNSTINANNNDKGNAMNTSNIEFEQINDVPLDSCSERRRQIVIDDFNAKTNDIGNGLKDNDTVDNGDTNNKMVTMKLMKHRPRVHTSSEGSDHCNALVPVSNPDACHLVPNNSYPIIQLYESPSHLHTSGITVSILTQVGKNLGKKWRMLLRYLEMDESKLDDIEYQHSSCGLDELGVQAMIAWKQTKGRAASVELLVSALEGVGLKAVAEQYCTSGFNTM